MALYHGCLKSLITSCRCSKILSLFCVWCLLVLLLQSPLVQSTSLTSRFLFSFYVYVSIRYGKYFLFSVQYGKYFYVSMQYGKYFYVSIQYRKYFLWFNPIREILSMFHSKYSNVDIVVKVLTMSN